MNGLATCVINHHLAQDTIGSAGDNKMANVHANSVDELGLDIGRSYFIKARREFINKNVDKLRPL